MLRICVCRVIVWSFQLACDATNLSLSYGQRRMIWDLRCYDEEKGEYYINILIKY